jgi:3-hydroxybutyryl-CoA dehydrogenase
MGIEKVAVLGLTELGADIAQVVSGAGYHVAVFESDRTALEAGKRMLELRLRARVGSEPTDQGKNENPLSRITFHADHGSLKGADLVIEATPEDLAVKKARLSEASDIVGGEAILATTTACFSVTEIIHSGKKPQRGLGMHFFKSPQASKLVELVRAEGTSQETVDRIVAFCAKIGKETVVAKDSPGFILNYLFVPYMNQAITYYDHGLADKEGLDTAIRMGLGYPHGPLTLIDDLGLDRHLQLSAVLYDRLHDSRFAPPPLLKRMVDSGKLGKKTGEGFYVYKEEA